MQQIWQSHTIVWDTLTIR